jgi:acyl carrier protein
MSDEIRDVIGGHARLPVDVDGPSADADLYQAGMTSPASVNVMLVAARVKA